MTRMTTDTMNVATQQADAIFFWILAPSSNHDFGRAVMMIMMMMIMMAIMMTMKMTRMTTSTMNAATECISVRDVPIWLGPVQELCAVPIEPVYRHNCDDGDDDYDCKI